MDTLFVREYTDLLVKLVAALSSSGEPGTRYRSKY